MFFPKCQQKQDITQTRPNWAKWRYTEWTWAAPVEILVALISEMLDKMWPWMKQFVRSLCFAMSRLLFISFFVLSENALISTKPKWKDPHLMIGCQNTPPHMLNGLEPHLNIFIFWHTSLKETWFLSSLFRAFFYYLSIYFFVHPAVLWSLGSMF